jgi:hypothetical protein
LFEIASIAIPKGIAEELDFEVDTIDAPELIRLEQEVGNIERRKDAYILVFRGIPSRSASFHKPCSFIVRMLSSAEKENG